MIDELENDDLYSLEIEIDDEVLEETGLDVISFVEDPAVKIDFEYFSTQNEKVCDEKCEMEHEFIEGFIKLAESSEYGIHLTPDDVVLDLRKTEFQNVNEIIQAIRGLNFLKRNYISQDAEPEIYWKYSGPPAERRFCKAMMNISKAGKIFTSKELDNMTNRVLQPGMGPDGANTYSIKLFCGGRNCKHWHQKLLVFRNSEGNKIVILGSPATDEEEIMMSSQNKNAPSPYGSIRNNARYRLSNYDFSVNDEKREVVGVVMLPNTKIKRIDEFGNPFSIIFTENTIKKMSEKFFRDNKHNNTDKNHDYEITTENTLLESWIVEDKEYDKSRLYGFDVPVGTWLVKYKINDDKLWEDIKNGVYKGFSLAGSFVKRLLKRKQTEQQFQEIVKLLQNVDLPQ